MLRRSTSSLLPLNADVKLSVVCHTAMLCCDFPLQCMAIGTCYLKSCTGPVVSVPGSTLGLLPDIPGRGPPPVRKQQSISITRASEETSTHPNISLRVDFRSYNRTELTERKPVPRACVVLCCAVLCCVVLCCVVRCGAVALWIALTCRVTGRSRAAMPLRAR